MHTSGREQSGRVIASLRSDQGGTIAVENLCLIRATCARLALPLDVGILEYHGHRYVVLQSGLKCAPVRVGLPLAGVCVNGTE